MYSKTPVLESLFNKVAGLRIVTLLKNALTQASSCEYCIIFKNTYFEEDLQTAASAVSTLILLE